MTVRSPFFVAEEVVSPLQCEDFVERLKHTSPNVDQQGNPTVTLKGNRLSEMRLMPYLHENIFPRVQSYYNFELKSVTPFIFEWYPTGYSGGKAVCENARYVRKKGQGAGWTKVKDYDFTCVLFLNDYNDQYPFDSYFETYGGKLEFPTHRFGFNPNRGTMIIFPCCPNFVNGISAVYNGNLNLVRFHLVATEEYQYNPEDFPGNYKEWFDDL